MEKSTFQSTHQSNDERNTIVECVILRNSSSLSQREQHSSSTRCIYSFVSTECKHSKTKKQKKEYCTGKRRRNKKKRFVRQ